MAHARIVGPSPATPLDGSWEVAALAPGRVAEPAGLRGLDDLEWIPCDGPMPVAAALRAAGRWNIDRSRDFDAEDWWYRCRFPLTQISGPVRLRFEGLATFCDVWLNARHILHSESMFVSHVVSIEPRRDEQNELVFRFHALAPLMALRRPRPQWRTALVSHQSLRWYRTSLLGRMPGWCPPVAPVGPWRPILVETDPLEIERADVRTSLVGDEARVHVSLRATWFTDEGGVRPVSDPSKVEGTLSVGGVNAPLACERLPDGRFVLTGIARLPRPRRWWPHTHGEPALYSIDVTIRNGAVAETVDLGRVGFRAIEVDRGVDGRGFSLLVNGTPVFCRGACWTPIDLPSLSASPAGYRTAIECLRDAGVNMIRIGGTMVYEADAFHDLCDELGILVWQDLMFANMDYPWGDERFARDVMSEVTQALARLQSRPSLAVICGGSEIEQQAAMLGRPAVPRTDLVEAQMAGLAESMAPNAIWLAGTPCGGTLPFHVDAGVSHYYGVGAYRRPFDDARRANVRFAAECLAFSNVPDTATIDLTHDEGDRPGTSSRWKSRVPRDVGAGWDFEDVRDHYLEQLFGINASELRARDPDRYLALGRVATGEAMARTFAEWRRPGSPCRGGLVWFAHDLWAGAGWGIVDSIGLPKAAYWYLKRVLAPVALLWADEGLNGLWLHAVNDTADPITAVLRIALYGDGVQRGIQGRATLTVPPRGHHSVHADALFDGFLDLTYAYRFGPRAHDVVAATLRDRATGALCAAACYYPETLPIERSADLTLTARLEPSASGYDVVLDTARFAHAVAIDIAGWRPQDNYFQLEPGETRRVGLIALSPGVPPRGRVEALNSRGPVSVAVAEAVHAS